MADKSPVGSLECWLTRGLRDPSQHERVAEELFKLLKLQNNGSCREDVKIVLDFYAHRQPLAFGSVVRRSPRLQSFLQNSPPAVDCTMRRVLFEAVTKASTECVGYCARVWLER